jgi:DNA gyrase subunit A
VVGMIIVNENDDVLTVTEKGYGKRTPVLDYRKTNRGGSGIINIKVTEKNGPVVALKGVYRDGDVMLITRNGIIIRSAVGRISVIGRNTQGVRLISLDEGDSLIDVAMCEKGESDEIPPGDTSRQIENPQMEPEDIVNEGDGEIDSTQNDEDEKNEKKF